MVPVFAEIPRPVVFPEVFGSHPWGPPPPVVVQGGAKEIGKIIASYGPDKLILLCHVPDCLKERMTAEEWMGVVCDRVKAEIKDTYEGDNGTCIYAEADADTNNNRFPIKMRDEASSASYEHLKKKGFVGGDDSDDDFDLNQCDDMQDLEW